MSWFFSWFYSCWGNETCELSPTSTLLNLRLSNLRSFPRLLLETLPFVHAWSEASSQRLTLSRLVFTRNVFECKFPNIWESPTIARSSCAIASSIFPCLNNTTPMLFTHLRISGWVSSDPSSFLINTDFSYNNKAPSKSISWERKTSPVFASIFAESLRLPPKM